MCVYIPMYNKTKCPYSAKLSAFCILNNGPYKVTVYRCKHHNTWQSNFDTSNIKVNRIQKCKMLEPKRL